MTANPLVAAPVDTSTAFGGAMLLDSLAQLSSSLDSGDWVAAGLAGVGVALDAVATAVDPLGSLIAAGLGWLMEHLEPLKGWLNDLTGDAGAVLGFAGTWDNVASAMTGAGDELNRIVTADLEAMSGASIVAYGAYANGLADRVRAAGTSASSMASALRTCSTVVQVVHDLVRDTLAQLVGSIISWVSTLVVTAGLATPYVASQVATRVSSIATRVGRSVIDVISTGKSLKNLLEAMKDALAQLASGVRGRLPGGGGGSAPRPVPGPGSAPRLDAPGGAPGPNGLPDVSDIPRGGGSTNAVFDDGVWSFPDFAGKPGFTADGVIDKAAFGTSPDEAFFWSGRTQGIGGELVAAEVAGSRGGQTLETLMASRGIELPPWNRADPASMEAWNDASAAFAESVTGSVRAVVGDELRPGNIWQNVELPRLTTNPSVTRITEIDPLTGVEKVVFP